MSDEEVKDDIEETQDSASDEDADEQIEDKDQFLIRLRKEKAKRLESEARIASLEEERKSLTEEASLATEAAQALAAERNITLAEARALLREESRTLLKKHEPKLQDQKQSSELMDIKLELQKRDLLDEHPEARSVMSAVMQLARATGQSVKDVYNKQFRDLVDSIKKNPVEKNNQSSPRQVFRDKDEDLEEGGINSNREYKKHMEASRTEKNRHRAQDHVRTALRTKLFGK